MRSDEAGVRRLLAVLDEQLAFAEQKAAAQVKKYVNPPSQCQHFFYQTDVGGFVRVASDAVFVVTMILLPPAAVEIHGIPTAEWSGVSFVDKNTGRGLVDAVNRIPQATFTAPGPYDAVGVAPGDQGPAAPYVRLTRQRDACYVLDSAVVLPRGGVVQIVPHFNTWAVKGSTWTPVDNTPLEVTTGSGVAMFPNVNLPVLSGYKVYG